jgi:hypothetical protein
MEIEGPKEGVGAEIEEGKSQSNAEAEGGEMAWQ